MPYLRLEQADLKKINEELEKEIAVKRGLLESDLEKKVAKIITINANNAYIKMLNETVAGQRILTEDDVIENLLDDLSNGRVVDSSGKPIEKNLKDIIKSLNASKTRLKVEDKSMIDNLVMRTKKLFDEGSVIALETFVGKIKNATALAEKRDEDIIKKLDDVKVSFEDTVGSLVDEMQTQQASSIVRNYVGDIGSQKPEPVPEQDIDDEPQSDKMDDELKDYNKKMESLRILRAKTNELKQRLNNAASDVFKQINFKLFGKIKDSPLTRVMSFKEQQILLQNAYGEYNKDKSLDKKTRLDNAFRVYEKSFDTIEQQIEQTHQKKMESLKFKMNRPELMSEREKEQITSLSGPFVKHADPLGLEQGLKSHIAKTEETGPAIGVSGEGKKGGSIFFNTKKISSNARKNRGVMSNFMADQMRQMKDGTIQKGYVLPGINDISGRSDNILASIPTGPTKNVSVSNVNTAPTFFPTGHNFSNVQGTTVSHPGVQQPAVKPVTDTKTVQPTVIPPATTPPKTTPIDQSKVNELVNGPSDEPEPKPKITGPIVKQPYMTTEEIIRDDSEAFRLLGRYYVDLDYFIKSVETEKSLTELDKKWTIVLQTMADLMNHIQSNYEGHVFPDMETNDYLKRKSIGISQTYLPNDQTIAYDFAESINADQILIDGLISFKSKMEERLKKTQIPEQRGREFKTQGGSILTNINEAVDRLELLMGNMEAGNTSDEVKNEASKLLDFLFKKGKITKRNHKIMSKELGLI